jgi:hypothetical protein
MLGNNEFLEEMFSRAEVCGTKFSNIFRFNNQKIDISKLALFHDDWVILEMYLSRKACINLVFIIMVYHFFEKFDEENLQIFRELGNSQVRKFSQEMQKCGEEGYPGIFQKVKQELKGVPVCA